MNKVFIIVSMLMLNAFNSFSENPPLDVLNEEKFTPMPTVMLKDIDGKDVDMKSFASSGKITIFCFWATWCSPCKKEIENIKDLLPEWEKTYNVQLVSINTDDSRNIMKVKPYVVSKNWKFQTLTDVNQESKRQLNYTSIPYSIIMDEKGNIVYKESGYQEGFEFVMEDQLKKIIKK